MTEPNYDNHLNPRRHERTEDEIDTFLYDQYTSYLYGIASIAIYNLWLRLSQEKQHEFIGTLVEQLCLDKHNGRDDKDFMATFTAEELNYEER